MECSLGIEAGAGTRAIGVLILILMECSLGTAKAAIEAGALVDNKACILGT